MQAPLGCLPLNIPPGRLSELFLLNVTIWLLFISIREALPSEIMHDGLPYGVVCNSLFDEKNTESVFCINSFPLSPVTIAAIHAFISNEVSYMVWSEMERLLVLSNINDSWFAKVEFSPFLKERLTLALVLLFVNVMFPPLINGVDEVQVVFVVGVNSRDSFKMKVYSPSYSEFS